MKILAVDTALGACSVAILEDARLMARRWVAMVRGHAEALAPMVEGTMKEAQVGFADLDRLAVTTGPGTFTGQRVGLAFMRGLRLALKQPLIGVTTLEAMAAAAVQETGAPRIAVLHEAKRGELYAAMFDNMSAVVPVKLIDNEAMMDEIESLWRGHKDVAVAGTGAEAARNWLAAHGIAAALSSVRQPDAEFVARLALGRDADSAGAMPLYLRQPDAKLSPAAVRIRAATIDDAALLAELNGINLAEAWDERFFAHVLRSQGGFGFIAEAHGAPTGFVLVRTVLDEAEILALAVSAAFRRNGIGRRLLVEAATLAGRYGAEKVFLEVAAGNLAARNLYESQGFRKAGRRKAYYADGQDALLLQVALPLGDAGLGKSSKVD